MDSNSTLLYIPMYISIGKVSLLLGVSISTLRRWDSDSIVSLYFRTPGGHRRYKPSIILEISGEAISENNVVLGYARVSGHKQKKDLQNQIQCIKKFARKYNYSLAHIYSDIASGLNDKRQNFLRLLRAIPTICPKAVIITYKDRLARFGIKVITLARYSLVN